MASTFCNGLHNSIEHQSCDQDYPYDLMPLETQIAGHGSEGDGQLAILKRDDGKLLKPVQPPPKGQREVKFYVDIQDSTDESDLALKNWIPKFYGVESVSYNKDIVTSGDYIVLQDITEGFDEPNIIDIKIGAKTYGPDATRSKMAQEDSKYVGTKGPYGFSVLGMIVHSLTQDGKVFKVDKSYGKTLKTEDVSNIPDLFFDTKNCFVPQLIRCTIEQMKRIFEIINTQRKYKIFASSVLLTYDALAVKKFIQGHISAEELGEKVVVRLIDFAHVFDAQGQRDENFLTGLNNLLTIFKECLSKHNNCL